MIGHKSSGNVSTIWYYQIFIAKILTCLVSSVGLSSYLFVIIALSDISVSSSYFIVII